MALKKMTNKRPVNTVIDQNGKIYTGLSLVILSYAVIFYATLRCLLKILC